MTDTRRQDDLRQMLMARQREMQGDVQARLRVGRTRPAREGETSSMSPTRARRRTST
jgi:hypothetical protein